MSIDRRSIKAEARERLRSAVPRPYYEGVFYVLIISAFAVLAMRVLSAKLTEEAIQKYYNLVLSGSFDKAQKYLSTLSPSTLDSAIAMILDIFRGVVAAGFSLFALNTMRRKEASLWNLMDGFTRFFPLVLLGLVSSFLVTLGLYLFVIPGILAAYSFRLAVYLLLDHPELTPVRSLLLSARLMRGRKASLFVIDLSFLGWAFLAMLPLSFGYALGGWLPLVLGALGTAAIGAWLLPYYEMSCVGFYEAIRAQVQSETPTV